MSFSGRDSNYAQNGFAEGTNMNNTNSIQHSSSVNQRAAVFGNHQWSWSGSLPPHPTNVYTARQERFNFPNRNHYGSNIPMPAFPVPPVYAHAHATTTIPPPPPPALPKIPHPPPPLPDEDENEFDLTLSPSPSKSKAPMGGPMEPTGIMGRPIRPNPNVSQKTLNRRKQKIKSKRTKLRKKERNLAIWDEHFQALVEYKHKHGDCNVPLRYKGDNVLGLGIFVNNIRRGAKPIVTEEQCRRLNSIGFDWEIPGEIQERQWQRNFTKLKVYESKYGDCHVPAQWNGDPSLAAWVVAQRTKQGKGKLPPHREKRLNSIDFRWATHRAQRNDPQNDLTWMEQIEKSHRVGEEATSPQKLIEIIELLDDTDNDDMDISDDSEDMKLKGSYEWSDSDSDRDDDVKEKADNLHLVDTSRALGGEGGDDNATKAVSAAQTLSISSRRQTRDDCAAADESFMKPSSIRSKARSPVESNSVIEKMERLKRTLMRAELRRAKSQLAILQMQKEEALKNAKMQLLAAKLRKEGALKRKAHKQNSSFLGEENPEAANKISRVSRSDDLADISAFSMKALLIMNIGSREIDNESVRHVPIDSVSIFSQSSSMAYTDLPEINDVRVIASEKAEAKVVVLNEVARLRLNLELAKRRLKLAGLQKKRLEVNKKPDPVELGDLISKEAIIEQAKTIAIEPAKATVQDLLLRQEELRSNIKASKEAQKELKDGQDISHLRQMIQSQQALLSQHGIAVKNCTELLQQTQFSFESELEANAQSQARLRDLLQRKASSEKMVRNVSSKIMKLRRKRDKDATRNMKGKGEDKST
jgi:hypothetical protein